LNEFERQKVRTVVAIVAMDADIVGLMVIENGGFGAESAIVELVDGINTEMGVGTYAVVDAGGTGDDDKRSSQVNCNLTRAAQALTAFISEQFGTTPALIVGDLNAYTKEDPINAIIGEGYTDLANYLGGAEAYSYSYYYSLDGQLGYLDHALTSASMLDKVVDTTEWYINADEPIVLDYNLDFQCAT
jgi:predicted extracellular nuclease